MLKFLFISIVVWLIVTRLMRFKFVVYRNDFDSHAAANNQRAREGTITIDQNDSKGRNRNSGGEYIDYEEVK